jgi:hypothetical protein
LDQGSSLDDVHYAEKQMKVLVNSNCELSLLKKNEKVRAADD